MNGLFGLRLGRIDDRPCRLKVKAKAIYRLSVYGRSSVSLGSQSDYQKTTFTCNSVLLSNCSYEF